MSRIGEGWKAGWEPAAPIFFNFIKFK